MQEFSACLLPVRELVAGLPAPGCDHGENEDPALVEQVLTEVWISLAHFLGHMDEVEFDRTTATGLEVDEQRPVLRVEHVARVRLAVEQLLAGAGARGPAGTAPADVADRSGAAFQRGA